MANFELAFSKTNAHEGGHANDPADRGGETYKGIARNHWPNWHGWVIIDRIKKQYGTGVAIIDRMAAQEATLQRLVKLFFKERFWDVHGLDNILHQRIAEEMYDTGVNMGADIAGRFLQEALNLCNNAGKLYPNITVDGKVGPVTRRALAMADADRVFKTMNLLQGERYLGILRRDETQEKYWGGWMNRVIC